MSWVHILVVEENGRRTVSAHPDYESALAVLRGRLRPADAHAGLDTEELYETLHGPEYALSIACERVIAPEMSTGRLTVLVVESEDGPVISVHPSTAQARAELARSWGVDVCDLQQETHQREAQVQTVSVLDPR